MKADEILRKHEDANEMHFHEVDRKWIIEAMEEYAALRQPPVMGSLVKSLNWIDSPEKRSGDIYKVMSRADVPMPHTVGNACIEITEQTYPHEYYEAKLWCFNRGTYMVEGKSVDDAKSNAFKWWSDFVCGFLNCP